MKNEIKNFLEFDGKTILFLSKDGTYWVSIKSICEVLGVDHSAQVKRIKRDPILGSKWSKQTIQVPQNQPRNMVCVAEKYVYGWLFSIQSDNPGLIEYKWKCYELLYDYFQGSISKRHQILRDQKTDWDRIRNLRNKLTENTDYKELKRLENSVGDYNTKLKECDKELIQLDMFTN